MAGKGMVAGIAALAIGTGKTSSAPASNPNPLSSSFSSGSSGNKSAEHRKISGTRGSFNVKGDGSVIQVQGTLNSGYCSGFGNARKAAVRRLDPLEECCGTDQSFNVEAGGKFIVAGGSISSGAFAGDGDPQEFSRQHVANLQPDVAHACGENWVGRNREGENKIENKIFDCLNNGRKGKRKKLWLKRSVGATLNFFCPKLKRRWKRN